MKTCDYCDNELTPYARSDARFCCPSCRVMFCRYKRKRSEMKRISVNEVGE